ncbi:protein sidekick [Frankliniella occidentalis]|uniref:Protein sidekick n=1 Tax=Frankliniella occidentalis TaxID=133901 RepID=A0A9C6TUS8_FRAOC|nr:protein sidekick [Frankliniella occidentalis]
MKDGHNLNDFSPENYLRILEVQRADAGLYQCVAKNTVGAIVSNHINVTVAYMGVFADMEEQQLVVESGDAVVIPVPPLESHPAPSITWQADGRPLPTYSHKYAVTGQGHLVILATDDQDQRAYRARATNTQLGKEEDSAYVRLVVSGDPNKEVDPEFVVRPSDVHVLKGEPLVELHCVANARPLHELETLWLKDGIPVENSGVLYGLNNPWNRTLSLLEANMTHTGVYTCAVRLRSGGAETITASASVVVQEKPSFVKAARHDLLGEFGASVTLACDALGVPPPNISWYRNAEPVPIGSGPDARYIMEVDGSLVVKKVQMEDSGMFQCFATNEAGEDSISLWLRVKSSKQESGHGRGQILDTGDLLVPAVRRSDQGKYTCIRANEAGSVTASAHLAVLVRTQIAQPPADTRVLLGHTATLQCRVTGDSSVPYRLSWTRGHELIGEVNGASPSSQRITVSSDGTLEIQAVRASDVGDYTCALHSAGGNETRSARLSVLELPFAPTNVRASRNELVSPRAINVSWAPGFDGNSPVVKYIVQKREVSDLELPASLIQWVTELSNVSATHRWVLLENLKAAARYQFRVSAVNSVGEGSPSEPSNVIELPQEAPSGPPLGLVGSARSSSEIITQWQPPLEEHRNGQILGYMIRYRLYGYNGSPWNYRNITNEAQRNCLVQELITWKDYVFQIAAYNNKGLGVFSEGVKIKTKEGVPEAAPTQVRVTALNSTAIQVWWRPPDPQKINGINQGYKLQAWKGDPSTEEEAAQMETVPPSLFDPLAEQTAIIGNLEKYCEYNITVLCFTDPGDGLRSLPVIMRTNEDVPDEISNLQFDEVSDRAVTVRWSPPRSVNGILTGYQLKYQVKDLPDTLKVHNLTADVQRLKVEHLQATTHYIFTIRAATSVGLGTPRVASLQSGVEPVLPQPPTKLAVTNIEAFSVVLQFTPGFDGNSSITKWTVEAQTTRNSTWLPVYEESAPDATTLIVNKLTPFSLYRLRLIANNVVGPSTPSEPTKEFQTIQAPPGHPPFNVTVRAMSATELRVRWIPLQQIEWFGNPRGYNITFREIAPPGGIPSEPRSVSIEDHTANSHILHKLEEFALYEIEMRAFNDVGSSQASPKAVERTRESVPSFGPMNVEANATSSTTVVVRWGEVPREHCNGQIEGFKVAYYAAAAPMGVGSGIVSVQYKTIASNSTFTTTLTELRKYVQYNIQVLAFTRLGDGEHSAPPVRVRTFEDTPGAPSNVSFPDVSLTTARIIWDVPDEPNGEILAYRVTYHVESKGNAFNFSREFPPSDRTFRATELEPEQYYLFSVTAQTRLGWGKTATALVLTSNNREIPQPPSAPQVSRSQIQSAHITFSWTPGRDGFAPLRYYTVQVAEGRGPWQTIPERVDPATTSYTAVGLKPFSSYRFRIQANNDMGPSGWSPESAEVRTLSAAPSKAISGLRVVPITTTSVEVHWNTLPEAAWSGESVTGGYRIVYQPVSDFPTALQATPKEETMGINSSSIVLAGLTRDKNYEVVVLPFNSQGAGPASPPVTVYVGEAVPTGEPQAVEAEPLSPTEVRLKWRPPTQSQQNGDLLGYKIYYLVTESPQPLDDRVSQEEELEVVPATSHSHSLVFLDKFTQYQISMLAFNPAGDGPRSAPVTVRTLQGLPGPPTNLSFSEITMSSIKVSWDPPKKRNGELVGYIVTYETAEQNERFSKQVKQKVSGTSLSIQTLEEEVTYLVTVRAQTIDYGPAISANVTTGPQDGSPTRPKELVLGNTVSSVDLHWINGASGKGPILGYYVQTKRKEETRWTTVARTANGLLQDFTVSFHNLLPSTSYSFRVIAYNKYGVSYPAYSEKVILTPSKLYLDYGYLQQKPFYRQTWFMVALAAFFVIIIICVIAILCVKSKSYKYKQESQKTLEESMAMDMDDRQELALELYRSRHQAGAVGPMGSMGTMGRRNTLGRKTAPVHPGPPAPMMGKSPPRPSPASVAYHSDEESLKGYDENPDDSSVTEKPSEISSSDSQGSESEPESERSDPHSFVNHYANVNDSLRQSWKRQKPVRNYSSYTDSEPEGSAVMSLNGGQIIMNNMARSRAPLPGFSSFV